MRVIPLVALCVLGSSLQALAAETLRVPEAKAPVLLDGRVDPKEWSDAKSFDVPGVAKVYVKQKDGIVLLAMELVGDNGTMDLYVSPADGKLYNLHASAKLGERTLQGPEWSNEWTWWNNQGWVANFSRIDDWQKRTWVGEKAREFQILRSRFPGKTWKVMLDIMQPAKPNWTTTSHPAGAKSTSTEGWIVLDLG